MKTVPSIRALRMTLALTICVSLASQVGAEIADGERDFVQQLLDRAFFDLAEQFCHQRSEAASQDNDRAEWELMLSECQEQHAWCMDRDSRSGMIGQSVERLTEFVRNHRPAAEQSLLLRMRQIELLTVAGLMEQTIQNPLSNIVASTPVLGSQDGSRDASRTASNRSTFALEATNSARDKIIELGKLLEERKRDFDPDVVRIVRDRSRLATARLALIQSQTVQESAAEVLRTEAENAAGQLQKSTNDAALRFRARLLLAEIQLERRDFAGFELRLGTAATSAVSQFDEATVAALKIRALLKQGQPSDALQEFVAASQAKLSLTQELQTLRLQGLLQLLELLTQLEESPQRASLTENTVREFEQLKDKTLMLTCGVWRERCVRLIGRFERVQLVGAQAAADLDYVALMVERGHLSEARQTLQILIQRTGPRRPELTAVLLMQAGSLSVQMKDWGTAVNELTQATEQFQTINDLPRAASADLLKVFAMGQQWNASESPQITELTYRAAIENHLQTFPQQPTIATVREWRARLIRSSSPLEAAKELLDVIALQTETTASETTASETSDSDTSAVASDTRIAPDEKLLNLVGDHLLEALAKVTPNEKNELAELDELAGQFEDRIRQIPRASEVTEQTPRERILRELLEFQRMALMLRRPLGRDTDWKSLGTQARDALTVMEAELEHTNDRSAEDSESAESEEAAVQSEHITLVRNAVPVCHGLIILSGMRQLAGSSEFEKSRSAVTDLPRSDRLQLTRQMIHQLFPGEGVASATTAIPGPAPVPRPGDVQFAHFLITLVASDELPQASGNVIDARIEELQLLKLLSQAAESRAVLDRRLNELLSMTMTDAQLKEVVTIVVDDTTRGNAASENSRREFWRAVQKRTKPGQDAWLEASLQMALNAEADGDRKEATRILGVVSVLHPDWGSPQRKARADELLDQLRTPR